MSGSVGRALSGPPVGPMPLDAGRCNLMDDEFDVQCPYCGSESEIYIEPDVQGTLVQDCEVCCNPWRVEVWWEGGERYIDVSRGGGSE